MSRIGNAPVTIPAGVSVESSTVHISVRGPKGTLDLNIDPAITAAVNNNLVTFSRKNDLKKNKSLHGLTRALFANMVVGVTEGWNKNLELVGVGYRAASDGKKLTLSVGFSHSVEIIAPEGVEFSVTDNTKIQISGIDKNLVGQVAANIRAIKRPEPYKGKGIRYEGEYIKRKAGKAGKVGAGATK